MLESQLNAFHGRVGLIRYKINADQLVARHSLKGSQGQELPRKGRKDGTLSEFNGCNASDTFYRGLFLALSGYIWDCIMYY